MDPNRFTLTQKLLRGFIFFSIVLSPLYVVRWKYFGELPTTLLELLLWATFALWVFSKAKNKDFSWPKTLLDKPILLFLIAGLVSLVITPDLRGGLGIFKAYLLEPIVFFYVLIDQKIDRRKFVLFPLLLSAFWLGLLGFVQVFTHNFIFASHEIGRAHAIFNSGNALALYLGPILVLAVMDRKSLKGLKKMGQVRYWFLVLIVLTAFILTKSRGGWVALAITAFLFWFFKFLKPLNVRRALRFLFFLLPVVSLLFLTVVSHFTPKGVVNPWNRPNSSTLEVRFCLWEGTRNLLVRNPILGVGLSGFKEAYSQKFFTCDAEPLEYPHNIFLTFWSETGILGLFAFLWTVYALMFQLDLSQCWIGLRLPFIYLLIHGLVDVSYFKNDLALQFWVIAAFLLLTATQRASQKECGLIQK